MGINSKLHKLIGVVEVAVGVVLDAFGMPLIGNELILMGITTFEGLPSPNAPVTAGQTVTVNSAIAPLYIVYGRVKTSGVLMIADSGTGSGDTDANYKLIAVAHSLTLKNGSSGLAVDGWESLWIDQDQLFNGSDIDGSGNCVTGSGENAKYAGLISYKFYDGSQTVVDGELNTRLNYWDSNAVAKGVCYSRLRLYIDPNSDQGQQAFPSGIPQTISVVMRGQKVYDPRKDSTAGGSGSHRKNSPSTWEWSECPPLIFRDLYVRPVSEGGAGRPDAELPDAWIAAAANICDQSITIPNGLGGTTTRKRYTCNIALSTQNSVDDNLQRILDCMAGWRVESAGLMYVYAGAYVTPTTTLDESWLSGDQQLTTQTEQDTRFNTVTAAFTDPDSGYVNVVTPPFAATGAVAADGGIVVPKQLNTQGINNQYAAQLRTQIEAKQSRNQRQFPVICNARARDTFTGEVLLVNVAEWGLSNYPMQIITRTRRSNSQWVLELRAMAPNTFDPETFNTVTAAGLPVRVHEKPPLPTGLTATGLDYGIQVTWTKVAKALFTDYQLWAADTSGGTYSLVYEGPANHFKWLSLTKATKWFKVRTKNYAGNFSAFTSPVSATSRVVKDGMPGDGKNIIPGRFSHFAKKLTTYANFPGCSVAITTSATETGVYQYSLLVTITNIAGAIEVEMRQDGGTSNLGIFPNQKWIWAAIMRASTAGRSVTPQLLTAASSLIAAGSSVSLATTSGGTLVTTTMDASASAQQRAFYKLVLTGGGWQVGDTLSINWQQIERQIGDDTSPTLPAPVGLAVDGQAGSAVNLMPLVYSLFNLNGQQPNFSGTNPPTFGVDATNLYNFPRLLMTFSGSSPVVVWFSGNTFNAPNIHLAAKKYLLSCYIAKGTSNNGVYTPQCLLLDSAGTTQASGGQVKPTPDHAANTDGIYYCVLDMTGATNFDVTLEWFYLTAPGAGTGMIQGVMIEELMGDMAIPSTYVPPMEAMPDPSGATMQVTGAMVPNVVMGTVSYTSTTTTVDVTCNSMKIRRADGSGNTTIPNFTQHITGASSSHSYAVYPYFDEVAASAGLATGASTGSPAVLFGASGSTVGVNNQNLHGRFPLSNGFITVSTPASGSGGGSGLGGGSCYHPMQNIVVRGLGERRAGELTEGMQVLVGPDRWEMVSNVQRKRQSEWLIIMFDNGYNEIVTPSHSYKGADGEWHRADRLHMKQVLEAYDPATYRAVKGIHVHEEDEMLVSFTVPGHELFTDARGPRGHNTNQKP